MGHIGNTPQSVDFLPFDGSSEWLGFLSNFYKLIEMPTWLYINA